MSKIGQFIRNHKILFRIFKEMHGILLVIYGIGLYAAEGVKYTLCDLHLLKNDPRMETMAEFQNIHKGKRCFIVATGPSVRLEDLHKLKNEITISMNSILNVLDQTDYRPDYYVIQDRGVFLRLKEKLKELDERNVFIGLNNMPKEGFTIKKKDVSKFKNVNLFYSDGAWQYINAVHDLVKLRFSFDCSKSIADGSSVTYSAIQLAVYMGFQTIYLVGCDCDYKGSVKHIGEYDTEADFSGRADLIVEKMFKYYRAAHEAAKKKGVKIYNATRGGHLEVFQRVDFEEILP